MRKWKTYLLALAGLLCLAVLGCQFVLDGLTPARIRQPVLDYAGVEPNEVTGLLGYPMLDKAKEIKDKVQIMHRNKVVDYTRKLEDENFTYNFVFNLLNYDIQEAQYWQQFVIGSEEQPFSLLGVLAGLGLGGIGTVIGGRYIKRPQEKELEKGTKTIDTG